MNIFKRSLSALLVLVMLVTAVPMGAIAVSAEANDEYIYVNVPATGVVNNVGDTVTFYFCPEESGVYTFSSGGYGDTVGSLYDSNGDCIGTDDDSGTDYNFSIMSYLESGEVYELVARFYYGETGEFTVTVSPFAIASVECDPITIIENTNGGWTTATIDGYTYEYFEYPYISPKHFTVTMNDGAVIRVDNTHSFEYNGVNYSFSFPYSQDYENRWINGKNIAKAQIGGVEFTYEVNVVDSPVVDIICDSNVTLMKNESGYFATDLVYNEDTGEYENTPEYFSYNPYPNGVTAVLNDGTYADISGNDYNLYWEEHYYNCGIITDQSYQNQWTTGNSYTATLSLANFTCDFNVQITETPVVSVEIPPVVVYENTSGYYCNETVWDEETQTDKVITYYYYDTPWPNEYVITLSDGSVYYNSEFYFGGQYFGISLDELQQSAGAPLGVGVHKVHGSVAGFEFSFDFEIREMPELAVDTPVIVDHRAEGCEVHFKFIPAVSGNYTFSSLDSINDPLAYIVDDNGNEIAYNDDNGSLNFSVSVYMEAGREYILVANGRETTCEPYTVVLEISPIVSVMIDDVYILENTRGYISECHNEDGTIMEYYHYSDIYPDHFVVTMKDGSVIEVWDNSGFEWNGKWFELSCYTYQGYEEQWGVGVNTAYARIAGFDAPFNVIIEETPVASVTYVPKQIIEHTNGYYRYEEYYNEETGSWEVSEYFYYWIPSTNEYIITLKDGREFRNEGFEWRGYWYNFEYNSINQNSQNPLGLGVHSVSAFVAGYKFDYEFEIIDSPVASVEASSAVTIQYSNGHYRFEEYWNPETGNYEMSPEYFYYDPVVPSSFKVTMKDGTVYENEEVYWDGEYHYLTMYDIEANGRAQAYDNQLGIGTYSINAGVLGCDFSYDLEIIASPVASVEIEPIHLTENRNGYFTSNWYWDDDTMSEQLSPEYFIYHNTYPQNAVITLVDGTVIHGNYFEWNGNGYSINANNDQSYPNRLLPGVTVIDYSIAGYHGTYTIEVSSVSSNEGFEYQKTSDGVIITACFLNTETIEIPETIEGLPVVGIAAFDNYHRNVKHLIIPDSVKSIGDYVFADMPNLETIEIGAGVKNLDAGMFANNLNLITITVDENNEYYEIVDGVLYNEAVTIFIALPVASMSELVVAKTCINIDGIYYSIYSNIEISFEKGHAYYVTVDGVTYNKDMTRVEFCSKNYQGDYVMPDTVTEIKATAFHMIDGLTSVVVSKQVTEIVYYTFASCKNLKSVELPEGLVSIGMYAFRDTPALDGVVLPTTLKEIGNSAFENSGITSIAIPDSCEYISYKAFLNSKIETLDLGEGVREIASSAFSNTPVKAVVIPDSTTLLGYDAFFNCTQLKSVVLGEGLESISSNTFANTGVESIVLPENIQYVGSRAFAGSALKSIEFQNPAIQLGNYAFSNCPLDELVLGDEMTHISEGAFAGTSIKVLDIPDSVTRIVYRAFSGCEDLSDISIPEGIVEIGGHTFDNTAWYNNHNDGVMYLDHAVYSWKGSMPADTAISIKNGSTIIADYAFQHQINLKSITLPESLEIIGDYAFYGCDSLESIHIPANVSSIGEGAFVGCKSLKNITVDPDNDYFTVIKGMLCTSDGYVIYDTNIDYEIDSIWFYRSATKHVYEIGEEFDPTGIEVIISYNNGYREFIRENFEDHGITFEGFDSSSAGECRIDLMYHGQCYDWFWIDVNDISTPVEPDVGYLTWAIPVVFNADFYDCKSLEFTLEYNPDQMMIVDVASDVQCDVEVYGSVVTITIIDVEALNKYQEGDEFLTIYAHISRDFDLKDLDFELNYSFVKYNGSVPVLGDITEDGEINAKDANVLKRIIAGSIDVVQGSAMFAAADINQDGDINAKDANMLKRIIAGSI